jgi:hypothetical protein
MPNPAAAAIDRVPAPAPRLGTAGPSSNDISAIRRISIYPAFTAKYYSLYIAGLRSLFGPSRLRFTRRGFPPFGSDCLALRIHGPKERKIYIHSNDMPEIDEDGLAWCDVFGKVNLDPDLVPDDSTSKVLGIGPTFAVRVWGPAIAELVGVRNFILAPKACGSFRTHLSTYRGHYASRYAVSDYHPVPSKSDYIFFNAALWEREPEANAVRARFLEAARSVPGITVEGGLTPRNSARGTKTFGAPEYERLLSRRYSPAEYFAKTRDSAVVLNNPAYRDGHSWRLAESLAIGKAIITTPIARALPAPLLHGTHVHYADGSEKAFRDAVEQICNDHDYRERLEKNARAYYEAHLAPPVVMRRLLDAALLRNAGPSAVRSTARTRQK